MRHGFDERVGVEHVLQDVLSVAGYADAEDFQLAALIVDFGFELGEDVHRVFDGVAVGELVDLGEDFLVASMRTALVLVEPPSMPM